MEGKAAMKGQALSWDERRRGVGGKKDSRGDKRVKVSLGGDQEEEQVLWSVLRSSLGGERSVSMCLERYRKEGV